DARIALMRLILLIACLATTAAAQTRPFKVLVSVDMEGITGVVTAEQLGPSGFEYARFREFMTAEALAAVEAAKESGATEILVVDAHGNGQNLLIDRFPADVRVIRSWPRPLMMMEGIDSSFNAAVFIGYHSATTNPRGVRAHTISSANLAAVELNGIAVGESGINAAIAGHFGVPVVAISGDDAAVLEAQQLIGPIEGAVVKRALSFHSANTLTPQAGQALIKQKVKAGLTRRASLRPYVIPGPVRLDITFKSYTPAEIVAYLPGIQRLTAHSVRFIGRDMIEVSRFLEFLNTYQAGLTP
ncbi:MAG: M55 family metallopeptidase, partial [Gemmatimonadota bacterium]|nr:M55 family metallopeptidase [Gemmatimonadota bacterium]